MKRKIIYTLLILALQGCATMKDTSPDIEHVLIPAKTEYILYKYKSDLYDAYVNLGGKLPYCKTAFVGSSCLGGGFQSGNTVYLMRNGTAWGHELRHLLIHNGMNDSAELPHFKK